MPVIRASDTRRTETPNAVMTTLASPTQGGASLAVWRVEMRPGQTGPLHGIDTEQILAVLEGGVTVDLGAETIAAAAGDTVVLPADLPRRITAGSDGVTALVSARPAMRAYVVQAATAAAPVGEKLVPPWAV
jgi:quercetin dioxygenase-like cupin family protein